MMKDMNEKNIHLQMSYQEIFLQMLYDHLLKEAGREFFPTVSREIQRLTL